MDTADFEKKKGSGAVTGEEKGGGRGRTSYLQTEQGERVARIWKEKPARSLARRKRKRGKKSVADVCGGSQKKEKIIEGASAAPLLFPRLPGQLASLDPEQRRKKKKKGKEKCSLTTIVFQKKTSATTSRGKVALSGKGRKGKG